MSEFYAHPNLYRPPVFCGSTLPPLPREPKPCDICHAPLPLIRHPAQTVCKGACQKESKRRTTARANARRVAKRRKDTK
jgi:hypothetical protein